MSIASSRNHVRWAAVALAAYLVAWCLPVYKGGTTLAKGGLPGWEALLIALGPLGGIDPQDGYLVSTLAVASGFTNILFLLGVFMLFAHPPRNPRRLMVALLVAAAINAFWFWMFDTPGELLAGYYLWAGSFLVMALAAWRATEVMK